MVTQPLTSYPIHPLFDVISCCSSPGSLIPATQATCCPVNMPGGPLHMVLYTCSLLCFQIVTSPFSLTSLKSLPKSPPSVTSDHLMLHDKQPQVSLASSISCTLQIGGGATSRLGLVGSASSCGSACQHLSKAKTGRAAATQGTLSFGHGTSMKDTSCMCTFQAFACAVPVNIPLVTASRAVQYTPPTGRGVNITNNPNSPHHLPSEGFSDQPAKTWASACHFLFLLSALGSVFLTLLTV